MQTVTNVEGTKFEVEPCIWGNHFLVYDDSGYIPESANEAVMKEHEELKQEVRRMIVKIQTTPVTSKLMMPLKERLKFLDTLQRLGVSFYFEKEIFNIMQRVHQFDNLSSSDDLYTVSTGFRLLRNQGIYVPAQGLFDKFVDQIDEQRRSKANEILSSLCKEEVDGLLALYEASFYAIPGEDILDRAQELTVNKLRSILPELQKKSNDDLLVESEKVEHVLCRSIGRNCERLVAKFYISIYKRELMMTFGESLYKFAVHDFNIRQAGFQKELAYLTKWREQSPAKTVIFSRQRIVEYYLWAICVYSEPQYHFGRMMTAKLLFMMTLVDDMYDTYGVMDDLDIFTEAFAKLDPEYSPQLPPYMKAIITTFKDLYTEVDLYNSTKPYVVDYIKREYERVVRAYIDDAKWIRSQTIPTYDEYFDVAMITGGITSMPAMYFTGMPHDVSQEALSWALDDPLPQYIHSSAVITRFLDDLSPNKSEEGLPQTAIPVYMKHYNLSEHDARNKLNEEVKNCYKEMNKGLLRGQTDTHGIPRPILKVIYGHVQGNVIFNGDKDCYSYPQRLKEAISTLFVEPVVM